jgi:hypothetical protein
MNNFLGIFIIISGYIIGLGAVTVIDILGFLGRKSSYWTEATIRAHKVTKPLIWVGIFLLLIGSYLLNLPNYFLYIYTLLILNGIFLTFYVSPYLLKMESKGKQKEILPNTLQNKIVISFIFSFLGWWGSLALLLAHILL